MGFVIQKAEVRGVNYWKKCFDEFIVAKSVLHIIEIN